MTCATSDLRLGFVSARPAHVRHDGSLWTDAGLGRILDYLAARCRSLELALGASAQQKPQQDHRLENLTQEQFHKLPSLISLAKGFAKAPACRRIIRQVEERCDVVLVQLPFAAPLALVGGTKPRVYHLCADILQQARTSNYYSGWRRLPALSMGHFVDRLQHRLTSSPNARTVTNGEHLLRHYGQPPGRALVSSSILDREILSVQRQRPLGAPFRVLFVGYLRHEKGIDVMLEAFARLLEHQPTAELQIVGGLEVLDRGVSDMLRAGIEELQNRGQITFHGHQSFGEDLFRYYADADVLALPSRNEGTPRVLVEARALGCPVIASAVGGIPSSIQDGDDGLLVPTGDADALARALRRVAEDAPLRHRLIEGGLERARQTTVEKMSEALLEECRLALQSSP